MSIDDLRQEWDELKIVRGGWGRSHNDNVREMDEFVKKLFGVLANKKCPHDFSTEYTANVNAVGRDHI